MDFLSSNLKKFQTTTSLMKSKVPIIKNLNNYTKILMTNKLNQKSKELSKVRNNSDKKKNKMSMRKEDLMNYWMMKLRMMTLLMN